MSASDILSLIAFLALNIATAASGAIFRPGTWYESLRKPRWRPPNWLFGPAWAVLYVMIAVAGWLVWRQTGFSAAIALYIIHLAINAAWSGIFFGLRRMDLAILDIVALWLSIVLMIGLFWSIDHRASLLLVPYLAWVTFATALNVTVWRMNRVR